MQKEKLILLLFFIGLALMFCSWCLSYPLSIDSPFDFVFNHISPLYWLGLPLLLASLYITAIRIKNNLLKWVITLGIMMSIYSLSYFYYRLPGSDSHEFRGMTEYFIETGDLTPSLPGHYYFDYPLFFILSKVVCCLLGLSLECFEFVLYAIIGLLYTTCLYIYYSKKYRNTGHIAVVAFFIMMTPFLNYQFAPFSLAFCFLLLLFMIETSTFKKRGAMLPILIIFTCMALTHPFLCVFFIIYNLAMYIISRNERYLKILLLTSVIYSVVEMYFVTGTFSFMVKKIAFHVYGTSERSKYVHYTAGWVVRRIFSRPATSLDAIAKLFSHSVFVITSIVSGIGFVILLIEKKLRQIDRALFFFGTVYAVAGLLIPILGTRTIPIIAIPISLGASFLSKVKPRFKYLFLIFVVLFTFSPLHSAHYDSEIMFQTKEAYQAENFMINHYNWTNPSHVLSHFRVSTYLQTKLHSNAHLETENSPHFPNPEYYDSVIYTVGLGKNLLRYNQTVERMFQEERFNVVYTTGVSNLALRSFNFTWTRP